MNKDGHVATKPTLKFDTDVHDPAQNHKLNSRLAHIFFPAERKSKQRQMKWQKEIGQELGQIDYVIRNKSCWKLG